MTTDLNTLREALESANQYTALLDKFTADAIEEALKALSRLEAAAAAEYERGRQDGMKQEHAMWKLARLGQEIEAAAVPTWKDHNTAQLVNELRDIAVQYRDTQQLRERIARVIHPLASLVRSVPVGEQISNNYLEQIYDFLESTCPQGFADEAFRIVPDSVLPDSIKNRGAESRATLGNLSGAISEHARPKGSTEEGTGGTIAVPVGEVKPVAPTLYQVMATAKAIHRTEPDPELPGWDEMRQHDIDVLRARAEAVLRAAMATTPHAPIEGWRMVPVEPTPEHIDSIALRYRHDFGLMEADQRENVRRFARQMYEECIGEGFYKIAAPQPGDKA